MNQRRAMEGRAASTSVRSVTSGVGHIVFLISFVLLFNEMSVLGESSGSLASSTPAACVCEGVPCEKNLTAAECPNGRVIPRKDCKCCFVCAKQLTEKCNSNELPCDSDFGLTCGEDNRCEASTPCSDDTTCTSDRFCIGGACADPCRVLPDVCKRESLKNGVCVVRNHRAMCSCSEGMVLDSTANECVLPVKNSHCTRDGRKIDAGSTFYTEKCSKRCNCEEDGDMPCKSVEREPECAKGFIPMSKITGDMSEVCKILIGNDQLFDGCCVPHKCLNATVQEDSKGSRGFRLTESQNNLEDEDDKPKPREMLLSEDDRPVLAHSEEEKDQEIPTTSMPDANEASSSTEATDLDDGKAKSVTENNRDLSPTANSTATQVNPSHVTVLKRTAHSAVIQLPMKETEAQLAIALSTQVNKNPGSADVWKIHKIPTGLPHITLSDLQPNTSYTLKYSHDGEEAPVVQFMTEDKQDDESHTMIPDLYNDVTDRTDAGSAVADVEEDVTGTTTGPDMDEATPTNATVTDVNGTNNVTTNVNSTGTTCLFNGTSYDVGQVAKEGCEQRCECMKDGQMKCQDRCSIPFFKKGHFAHDPLCYEEPSGVDECCVIAACARSNINNGAGEARVLKLNPCDTVKCGPNSECRYEVSPSGMQSDQEENQETLCVCKEGFLGDPSDEKIGCIQGASSTTSTISPASSKQLSSSPSEKVEGCIFNNKTYPFGAEHFDGCSYKCHCESSGEFLCRPRCTFQRDEEKEIPTGCEIKKDPSDPECCEMIVCHGEPLESGSRKENPDIPVDGCVYKNQTYGKDVKFYDGCEQQCMCFSNGDVTCQARCPPAGPNTHDACITLPDPTDKCCTVTICDAQEILAMSDVMKAANGTLVNATALTTAVPILVPIGRSDDIPTTTLPPSTSTSTSTTTPKSETAGSTDSPIFNEDSKETMSAPVKSSSEEALVPSVAKLSMVIPVNETSVMVTISLSEKYLAKLDDQMVKIYYSTDMESWMELEARIKDLYVEGSEDIHTVINGLLPGREYFFKAKVNETETNVLSGYTRSNTGSSEEFEMSSHEVMSGEEGDHSGHVSSSSMEDVMCKYKDRFFSYGQEFYDGCDAYCSCEESGKLKCVPIECPVDLGLELLDANCLKWEPITENFRKEPPHCCPEMRCVKNSTCSLAGGFQFSNFEEIPQKITGCDKRCHCEYGNITCQNLCPPMSEKPPADLPCPPEMAMPVTMPPNECCFTWVCRNQPHPNVTDGSPSVDKHLLNHTLTHDKTNMTHLTPNGTFIPYHPEDDQFVPPSTGNEPSFVPLNKINRDQLQDLLHQLSTINTDGGGGGGGGHQHSSEEVRPGVPQGTYLSVRDPAQVQDLEKSGAKVIEQAEDGSFIVFIPSHPLPHRQNPIPIYAHPHPEVLHGHPGPSGFPFGHQFQYEAHPHGPSPADQLGNVMMRALNESTLQIDFTVSPVLVGLRGEVEVLYTKDFMTKTNPDQWEKQIFQQAEDLIDNSHLQLFLTGLEPDTDYHLKIQVIMKDIQNAPSSELLIIRTPPPAIPTTTLPPEIIIDAEVNLVDVTSNTVKVSWRKFNDFEGSLIDGVQIKYRAEQDQVYSTTPLIHRSITNYELTNLQPGQSYEVDLLFIPFTNQTTELRSEKPIHIKTLPEEDLYGFTIAVEAGKVTESSAELIWDGVPYPEDKYVNIYQVIYQSDLQKEQKSTFKVAKRDNNKKAVINDLKPGTRYRVWVEAFLTNGKKKRTNVIDVVTKAGQLPTPDRASQDKLLEDARSKEAVAEPGSYYGALVALAIIAALSIMGIVVLLMILIRKQNHAKAPINDRKSESSYDNPSFKNYDLESNGHSKPGDP